MTLFDDNPLNPPEQNPGTEPSIGQPADSSSLEPVASPLAGDPLSYAAVTPTTQTPSHLPEDLHISWSWPHLILLVLFGVVSFAVIQGVLMIHYLPHGKHFANQNELGQFLFSKPLFLVGGMVLPEALILFFLYITLAVLRDRPFWRSLGWRKFDSQNTGVPTSPWIYFAFGCALSILVLIIIAASKPPEHTPIQDLLKSRNTAIAFMAMAVLIAPLFEETIFRGYLYPLFVRFISFFARLAGVEHSAATRVGISGSIVLTGVIFGLVHGAQLGWSFALVLALVGVGIVLTFARARSGTVFASFLLHLGYNSTIAFLMALGFLLAKGAKSMPPHP